MSEDETKVRAQETQPGWYGPSEPQIHTEHRAALDATLFRAASDPYELVLELESGQLRVKSTTPEERS